MIEARLPFVCVKCGLRYGDRGRSSMLTVRGNVSGVEVEDNRMSCPRCGTINVQALPAGEYNIRDGKWYLVRQIARDVLAAQATISDYDELARLIRLAQTNANDGEQVAAIIEAKTPFTQLARTLRKYPDRTIAILGIILAVILWLVPSPTSGTSAPPIPAVATTNLSTHQLDELAQKIADDLAKDRRATVHQTRQPGRNEPCSCGSKKKYKKCCGDPTKR